jgi:hypothetical protein
MSHHPYFAIMAILKACRSQNPALLPTWIVLDYPTLAKCILSLSWLLGLYRHIIALTCLQELCVRSKQDIAYVGIAWAMLLIKISLPVMDNNFSFHPYMLVHILSLIYSKVFSFGVTDMSM